MVDINNYLEYLHERKIPTITKDTKEAKIARDIGARAIRLAKNKHDTLYKRMMFHLKMYKTFKEKIKQKYTSRVKMKARS